MNFRKNHFSFFLLTFFSLAKDQLQIIIFKVKVKGQGRQSGIRGQNQLGGGARVYLLMHNAFSRRAGRFRIKSTGNARTRFSTEGIFDIPNTSSCERLGPSPVRHDSNFYETFIHLLCILRKSGRGGRISEVRLQWSIPKAHDVSAEQILRFERTQRSSCLLHRKRGKQQDSGFLC